MYALYQKYIYVYIHILSSLWDIQWTERKNQVYLQEGEEVRKAS